PTGLSFALVLLFGERLIPFLFLAPLLADIAVRQLPWPLELVTTMIVGGGYSVALLFLLRSPKFNPALSSLNDLFLLLLTALVSAAIVAAGYVTSVVAAGLLPQQDFLTAYARFWVGDMIGIAVMTPFALIYLTRKVPIRVSPETAAQFASIPVAL